MKSWDLRRGLEFICVQTHVVTLAHVKNNANLKKSPEGYNLFLFVKTQIQNAIKVKQTHWWFRKLRL